MKDREFHSSHPTNCTCVECVNRRLGTGRRNPKITPERNPANQKTSSNNPRDWDAVVRGTTRARRRRRAKRRIVLLFSVAVLVVAGWVAYDRVPQFTDMWDGWYVTVADKIEQWFESASTALKEKDYTGRVLLKSEKCRDTDIWKTRVGPDGARYWVCDSQTEITFLGAELKDNGRETLFFGSNEDGVKNQFGALYCISPSLWDVRIEDESRPGGHRSERLSVVSCLKGIDPEHAVSLVKKLVAGFNSYDEAKVRTLTTPEYYSELRSQMLWAKGFDVELTPVEFSSAEFCLTDCEVAVKLASSGIWGSDVGTTYFIVRKINELLLVAGEHH